MVYPLLPQLVSNSSSRWDSRITVKSPDVGSVDSGDGAMLPQAPSLESLQRRHESADPGWMRKWIEDDVDPCRPA